MYSKLNSYILAVSLIKVKDNILFIQAKVTQVSERKKWL